MAIDQAPIGQLTARLMDRLEEQYDEGEIGSVILIVDLVSPEHGHQLTAEYNDSRIHANIGMLDVIRHALLSSQTNM